MKEPTRWLDDPGVSPEVRSVLTAAGAPPTMSPNTETKLAALAAGLVAHGAALPAAAAGAAAKPALGWLGAGAAGKTIAIASLMGAIGSGSYLATRALQQTAVTTTSQPAKAEVSQPESARARPPATAQPAMRVEPIVVGSAAIATAATARPNLARSPQTRMGEQTGTQETPARRRGTVAFDELSIGDEARLLEQARASLPANPTQALEIASTHKNLYPAGQLSDERELIVIDALLRLGRRQEAEQRAAPRLRLAPDSIYASRLRRLLAGTAEQ